MPQIPYIPETAPFSPEQRAWLNGFLAGLHANAPGGTGTPAPAPITNGAPPTPADPLVILYGSQTGSAEGLAKRAAREAQQHGFAPRVLALNDYEQADLPRCGKALIITSTWGDGDPPDNAVNFWSWLKSDAAPRLEGLQFAVLGLGDRNYSDFCGASKKFETRLAALGARPLAPRGECDVDYETEAGKWFESLWGKLGNGTVTNGKPALNGNGNGHHHGSTHHDPGAHGKSNPFPARLLKNVLLNKPGSGKEVRHFELSLQGSGLSYEAGDALGVVPVNCPKLVAELLAALKCAGDEPVEFGGNTTTLGDALTHRCDLMRPSGDLLACVDQAAGGSALGDLLLPEKLSELQAWLRGRDVLDVLRLAPSTLPCREVVARLRKLTPRLYSISSSPKAHAGEVHLTVSSVRYEIHGRRRLGVASTFLADRVEAAAGVKVYVQPSHGFKPPAAGEVPMIMVGPGTGIAPFRAFLEEREAMGAKGRNWLFFGDQKRDTDFLYEEQISGWVRSGHLTRLDLAFSRDQSAKLYVQHRMLENAGTLWYWLEAGAHFYVCGDASRMAKDVDAALHKVVETAGGRSPEEARDYVAKLVSGKRYQRDVY